MDLLREFNTNQLSYIATQLGIERDSEYDSLMNALDSQGIKYPELKNKVLAGEIKTLDDLKKLRKISKSTVSKSIAGDTEKVFEDDNFLVIVPFTHQASCKYGAGTKWCTASKGDIEHWSEYILDGHNTLYYILDKTKSQSDNLYKVAVLIDDEGNVVEVRNALDKKINFNSYFKNIESQFGYDLRDKVDFKSKIKTILPVANKEIYNVQQERNKTALKKIKEYIANGSKGDLDLSETDISSLPDDLKQVDGDLKISRTNISSLPDGLKISGYLEADYSSLASLPDNLKVGEGIFLTGCKEITSLPDNLKVNNTIDVQGTSLSILPKNLQAKILYIMDEPAFEGYTLKQLKQMLPNVKKISKL